MKKKKGSNSNSNSKASNNSPLVVIPPSDEDSSILFLLRKLDETLKKSEDLLWSYNGNGVRFIQGKRFEVFIQAKSKTDYGFKAICELLLNDVPEVKEKYHTVDGIKTTVLQYAINQAKKDTRLIGKEYKFDNFSILVSYGTVPAQLPHIDLIYPNYQFGLILTKGANPTTIYEQNNKNISNVHDLKRLVWTDMPDDVVNTLQNNKDVNMLIRWFGNVLCHSKPYECKLPMTTGTLLSLPGSIVHAGPGSDKFRSILFFSASETNEIEYNPDTQYSAPFLCCDLTRCIWNDCTPTVRTYLLIQVANIIKELKNRTIHQHLCNKSIFQRFISKICYGQYPKGKRNEFIKEFATNTPYLDISTVECGPVLSVPDLYVRWNNNNKKDEEESENNKDNTKEEESENSNNNVDNVNNKDDHNQQQQQQQFNHHKVCIYQSAKYHDNVILFYSSEEKAEYEGLSGGYTLEMTTDKDELFDGTNGTLRDNDGKVLHFYTTTKKDKQPIIQQETTIVEENSSSHLQETITTTISSEENEKSKVHNNQNDNNNNDVESNGRQSKRQRTKKIIPSL